MGATIDGLAYAWWFSDLPGYRPHPTSSLWWSLAAEHKSLTDERKRYLTHYNA